ncbi:Bug family tripartite tricarboxylate transporter substrate binding protein [Plastoroseomonas arctica]|uniref:Tripartite tricarboxylate transporter substrate binding protein n=1 Tax=Plastoroseomonas arctica TaxID=1509237 RepID=A0AAF1JYA4_9PROT|nr:tripartite tricarboxylate transporter substrate binding protein [Plastoroseomonas arctica]MBR0656747.1 tripartite tricarboxylate transporter substrate binding protein [Plastoroseomonas arctica]
MSIAHRGRPAAPDLVARRVLLAAPALLSLPLRAQPAWPQRPVRLIVAYAAGGGTDIFARALGEAMRPALVHPVIVENRAGGAGVIGSDVVSRAEPDGHTLLAVVSTHVMNKYYLSSMPYDPIRDFTPIAMLSRNTMVLSAGATQPFATLPAMIAHARQNPGAVGTGSTEALSSFCGQELARRARIDTPDIQYRSGGPLMNDVVAGHLPVGWTSTASAMPHMQTGRVRILANAGATRTPFFPDVPTVQESGIADFDLSGWVAMFGPRGMDPVLAGRIYTAVAAAFTDATLRARLTALGVEPDLRDPAGLTAALVREDRLWAAASAAGTLQRAN